MGRIGIGKSTLINIHRGLERPDSVRAPGGEDRCAIRDEAPHPIRRKQRVSCSRRSTSVLPDVAQKRRAPIALNGHREQPMRRRVDALASSTVKLGERQDTSME